jgi:monovalent cation/hydrogen antiporter
MESFEVVLLLLGCVLVSSIFDQVFSRLAMPLVQIALGAVVGFLIAEDPSAVISDPELFLHSQQELISMVEEATEK